MHNTHGLIRGSVLILVKDDILLELHWSFFFPPSFHFSLASVSVSSVINKSDTQPAGEGIHSDTEFQTGSVGELSFIRASMWPLNASPVT